VDLLATVNGHVVTLDERVHVTQLSVLGMTVESHVPLSPRVQHAFRLVLGTLSTTVIGRVVHSRIVVQGDDVTHVAGIEFMSVSDETLKGLQALRAARSVAVSRPWQGWAHHSSRTTMLESLIR
jgi:hypothetical protein